MFGFPRKLEITLKMADYTKLQADIAALDAKLTAYIAAQVPPAPPVDEQPTVDSVAASVEAITAKIPS